MNYNLDINQMSKEHKFNETGKTWIDSIKILKNVFVYKIFFSKLKSFYEENPLELFLFLFKEWNIKKDLW